MRTIYVLDELARKVMQNESARHAEAISRFRKSLKPHERTEPFPSRIVDPQAQRRAEYLAETGRQENN